MTTALWRDCKLGDVITLKRGYDLPHQHRSPGPFPIVSSSGITDYHAEAKVKGPGVVTGRYGTLGAVYYVEGDFWPLNTSLYVRDFNGNDPRFIAYFLQTMSFASQNAAGAVPGVNRNHLHAMEVRVPILAVQRRIAEVLSAYDGLIENCQRRIRILEEVARALYREWFVLFRYPGHENVPLVSSPLGEVPKKWAIVALADLTDLISRGIAPRYAEDGPSIVINQKCIRDQRLNLGPARRQQKPIPSDKLVRVGDVLINSTGVGTLGRVAQVLSAVEACTVDTHVTIVRPKAGTDPDYFGVALLSLESSFERMGIGATGQTELGRGAIGAVELCVPPRELSVRFGELVRPMRAESDVLSRRIENLRKTRDLLLPRLLSGKIGLEDVG